MTRRFAQRATHRGRMMGMHVWMPLVRTGTGSEAYTHMLARRLRERGHQVTLDAVPHGFQYAPWLAALSVPRDADVTLANSWNAAAFASNRVPLVSVCHLVVHDERLAPYKSHAQSLFHRRFVLPMERASIRKAAINVAVSPMVARQMETILGAGPVMTVNNGVDVDYFRPRDHLVAKADRPFRLLFVGKPSLRKGFDIVDRIVDRLGDEVAFTCAGGYPTRDLPRPTGTYTGVLDRAELREAYRGADMLLFPSRMEGLSLAVAEAMACGLPAVVCEGSAMEDFVPREAGIVRREDDIDGFVEAISEVMRDPARHHSMRTRARAFAAEHLSEERWVDGMEAVLRKACSPDAID